MSLNLRESFPREDERESDLQVVLFEEKMDNSQGPLSAVLSGNKHRMNIPDLVALLEWSQKTTTTKSSSPGPPPP